MISNYCSKCLYRETDINKHKITDFNLRLVESDSILILLSLWRMWLCLEQGVSQISIQCPLSVLHRGLQTRTTPGWIMSTSNIKLPVLRSWWQQVEQSTPDVVLPRNISAPTAIYTTNSSTNKTFIYIK